MQKRILAIHDLSCMGRCSLTVALPILSACGHNCSVLPTAILSTHTGEFTGYVVHDLSEEMLKISEHLQKVSLGLDAIYTGYLANWEQVESVKRIFAMLGGINTLKFVDPAFADNGKLYSLMDDKMVKNMRNLISHADFIIPNATEALMLCNSKLKYNSLCINDVKSICEDLSAMGPSNIIITAAIIEDNTLKNIMYNKKSGEYYLYSTKLYQGVFHGTGDVIASTILALLMQGKSPENALAIASDFIEKCIQKTLQENLPLRYGVCFEKCLIELIKEL